MGIRFSFAPSPFNQSHESIKELGAALPTSEEPDAEIPRKLETQKSKSWWKERRPEGRAEGLLMAAKQPFMALRAGPGPHRASEFTCCVVGESAKITPETSLP